MAPSLFATVGMLHIREIETSLSVRIKILSRTSIKNSKFFKFNRGDEENSTNRINKAEAAEQGALGIIFINRKFSNSPMLVYEF